MKTGLMLVVLFVVISVGAEPEFVRRDVNPLFLKKMPAKPWWDKKYKTRMPVLVSETIGKKRLRATVDFICDFDEKVNADSVRIITPWEEEIPSQAIALDDKRVEIIFQTDLREYEQKPFFIYYGNSEAGISNYDTDLVMKDMGKYLDIRNEKIQAWFTGDNNRSGKIKKIRIIGSPVANQLTEMTTGAAWAGLNLGTNEVSTKPIVKIDGPLKKMIEYEGKGFAVQYAIYSFSPQLVFRIIPREAKTLETITKWVAGGGDAYDMFHYEGLKGPMQFKAGPDMVCESSEGVYPREDLTKWMKEGWAAISDRKVNETMGVFFERDAMTHFSYYSQTINGGETFFINYFLKGPVAGALVALGGDWREFRSAYIDWKNPPVVNLGKPQPYEDIGYKVPKTNDFTRYYPVGNDRCGLRMTDDFADNLVYNVRKLSGNAVKVSLLNFPGTLPCSRKQYETYTNLYERYYAESYKRKYGEYNDSMAKDSYLQDIVMAAHKKGVAVRCWCFPLFPFGAGHVPKYTNNPLLVDLMLDIYKISSSCGIDSLNTRVTDEWAHNPPGSSRSGPFWEKNAEAWFNHEQHYINIAKRVREEIKREHPDLPISALCSTDGWLAKMDFIDEKAPYLDTVENEFVPGMIANMPQLKYGIKRMQGAFGNDGRSIQHHFYYFDPNPLYRVSQMELPMIFGIKSFCHEAFDYFLNNPEIREIGADFYRLTDYTALDDFMAGCVPYKFMALFRDADAFRDDIRNNRTSYAFPGEQGEQESRCKQLTILKNIPLDILFNRFFNSDEMKKYRLVFIPSDRMLRDEYVKEIEEYVKEGGCVVSEGNTIDNKNFARLTGVKKAGDAPSKTGLAGIPVKASVAIQADGAEVLICDVNDNPAVYLNRYGKGRIVYSPYILTDDLNSSRKKEVFVRDLIVKLAGPGPIIPLEDMATCFDSALLVNGKEYFYGVYNPSLTRTLNTAIKLDLPEKQNYHLLDVKTGKKVLFNGTVKVNIAPLQTAFYIIGGEKATVIPELKKAVQAGGCSDKPGMEFVDKKYDDFAFKFTSVGKPKKVGVLHISDKSVQSQAWGAEAVYDCLKENLSNVKVEYLENLQKKTLNGCDAVVVPNMGLARPSQLDEEWGSDLAEFARQGGGVIVMHHAIGVGEIGNPPFPSIGKWSGNIYAVHNFAVAKMHPVTEGLKIGEVFTDNCWDYDEVEPGEDGVVLVNGLKDGIPTPALVAGKFGKGNVVVSGIGIGAGYRKENGKYIKYEAPPENGLKEILLNSVKWILSEQVKQK